MNGFLCVTLVTTSLSPFFMTRISGTNFPSSTASCLSAACARLGRATSSENNATRDSILGYSLIEVRYATTTYNRHSPDGQGEGPCRPVHSPPAGDLASDFWLL